MLYLCFILLPQTNYTNIKLLKHPNSKSKAIISKLCHFIKSTYLFVVTGGSSLYTRAVSSGLYKLPRIQIGQAVSQLVGIWTLVGTLDQELGSVQVRPHLTNLESGQAWLQLTHIWTGVGTLVQ